MSTQLKLGLVFLLYCLTGGFGVLWISDEFDAERSLIFSYFAFPLGVLTATLWILEPRKFYSPPILLRWVLVLLFFLFSWGNLLLLNALTDQKVQGVRVVYKDLEQDRSMSLAWKKGGLGMLYRHRW